MEPLRSGDPREVGGYRLEGRLGAGGMGQVFLGRTPGGRKVAVKLIRAEYAEEPAFRARFEREVSAAAAVGGIHTAQVIAADPAADPPWLVTAYISGPSLDRAVADTGPFDVDRLRELGAGLAEGLAAIHACGLIHRDLKPSNVILADDGPRIIDFGIARDGDATGLTAAGAVLGTLAYMSPEQVRGQPATTASDVFSLGTLLAYAAAGAHPFGTGTAISVAARIMTEPPDLSGVTADHGLRALLTECLAKDPADRPQVPDVLARLAADPAPAVPEPPAVRPPPHTPPEAPALRLPPPGPPPAAVAAEPATTPAGNVPPVHRGAATQGGQAGPGREPAMTPAGNTPPAQALPGRASTAGPDPEPVAEPVAAGSSVWREQGWGILATATVVAGLMIYPGGTGGLAGTGFWLVAAPVLWFASQPRRLWLRVVLWVPGGLLMLPVALTVGAVALVGIGAVGGFIDMADDHTTTYDFQIGLGRVLAVKFGGVGGGGGEVAGGTAAGHIGGVLILLGLVATALWPVRALRELPGRLTGRRAA